MSTDTVNYGFKKDNEDEFYNVNVVNANLDKIDTEMKRIEDESKKFNQQVVDNTEAIVIVDTKLDTHIEIDDGHVRYIGNAVGTNAKTITTDKLFLENAPPIRPKIGASFRFKNGTHNTDTVTLQIVSPKYGTTTAYPVYNSRGEAFKSGDLKGQLFYTVVFTGTSFQLQGEGGGYGVGDLIKANDLIGREYIQVDQHRAYANGSFLNGEIATINGVEYAFTYSVSSGDTAEMSCTETLTGRILWSRWINYHWQGRIVIKDSFLYIGYYDRNGVVTTGCGLEVMNALTGARIKATRHVGSDNIYVEAIRDLCYNATLQEIIVIGGSNTNYLSIGRYDLNGNLISMSGNLNSTFSSEGENPSFVQSTSTYIYMASTRCVYQLGTGFGLTAKTTALETYSINGLALNTINGVTHTVRNGSLTILGTFLTVQANVSVTSSIVSGLVIKGDLLSYASPMGVFNYRITADGRNVIASGYVLGSTNLGEHGYNSSKCIGVSKNAFLMPVVTGREYPPIYTKTLKVIR